VAVSFVFDTNIVLYHLTGKLADPLPVGQLFVSIITEIELLSYPAISPSEEASIVVLLSRIQVFNITDQIRDEAIRLRKAHKLKLPDSLIVATAIASGSILVSNDLKLANLSGIQCQSLKLR
jgi:predicted nucleic acid-binding protein